MRLQEEYLKRHNIQVPQIYHTDNATVILALRTRPQVILNIEWQEVQRRPGNYVFNFLGPNHDGYLDGNYFIALDEKRTFQYGEYRNFLIRWAKNLNFTPIKDECIELSVWEMFLYCFDGWLAENMDLEDVAFAPIDLNLTLEQRKSALDVALFELRKYNSLVGEIYDVEFKRWESDYAGWLVDLIDYYGAINESAK